MKLKVLASGSTGNCYILENDDTALIIEAGVSFKKVKGALNFNVKKIAGVIVSHIHDDHAKYVRDYLNSGIKVYVNECMFRFYNGKLSFLPMIYENGCAFKIGSFDIKPFELIHDVPCSGFQIDHKECGRIIFITDTRYSPYIFDDVNHWIIECNHSYPLITESVDSGKLPRFVGQRVLESHMSLETLIDIFNSNDTTSTRTITLTHLSTTNADPDYFKQQIINTTGKPTEIAVKGLEVDFNQF